MSARKRLFPIANHHAELQVQQNMEKNENIINIAQRNPHIIS
jgi:hypothetical protein